MLDDIWTTRRWVIGAVSFAVVALALVVGLKTIGDGSGEVAPVASTPPAAGTGAGRPDDAGEPHAGAESCRGSDESCQSDVKAMRRQQSHPEGTVREPAAGDGADQADVTSEVPEGSGLSVQEGSRESSSTEPNVNPDHYGPGGEPAAEPSPPSAEGARPDLDSEPNRNPTH